METQLLQVNGQLASSPTDADLLNKRIRLDLLLADIMKTFMRLLVSRLVYAIK
jgi:hypothetical protein